MCSRTHKGQKDVSPRRPRTMYFFANKAMPTSQKNARLWRPWLIAAWTVHFLVTIIVITYGTINNFGERKYIPADTDRVEGDCSKAFVDVFSESIESPGAFVCCNDDSQQNGYDICMPPPSYLIFARRLAKFPEAWLLPLFPFIIRGALHIFRMLQDSMDQSVKDRTAIRRLYLYLVLIQVRGWVLYLVLNAIEEMIVENPGTNCWYQKMLPDDNDTCQGRVTDFSDHIVLYFAQILPIALCEVLHSFVVPFWDTISWESPFAGSERSKNRLVPTMLLTGLAHLYHITLLGAYKTSAYFHTGPEIFTGYIVSLTVQIPLLLLQCTDLWPHWREYFFGHVSC